MTSIDSITGTIGTSGPPQPTATRTPKQSMDSDMFMNLLITQLAHQDPSSPMDTNQMIGQTTQLAMMEKLTNIDTTNTENFALQMRTSAAAIIGQQVSYLDSNGKATTGKASAVSFAGSVPVVTVDGVGVSLDSLIGIGTQATA